MSVFTEIQSSKVCDTFHVVIRRVFGVWSSPLNIFHVILYLLIVCNGFVWIQVCGTQISPSWLHFWQNQRFCHYCIFLVFCTMTPLCRAPTSLSVRFSQTTCPGLQQRSADIKCLCGSIELESVHHTSVFVDKARVTLRGDVLWAWHMWIRQGLSLTRSPECEKKPACSVKRAECDDEG